MAAKEQLEKVRGLLQAIRAMTTGSLTENPAWGSINFRDAEAPLDLIQSLAGHLQQLPIELIPEPVMNEIIDRLTRVRDAMNSIAAFDLAKSANPNGERAAFSERVREAGTALLVVVQGWIPFLAYQKGDIQKNINDLSQAVENARAILDKARVDTVAKAGEVDTIVQAAREASAAVGVGHFTSDFSGEATRLDGLADTWLKATAWFAGITLLVAIVFAVLPMDPAASSSYVVHFVSSKVVALVVLLSATFWCGRIYKATKHQAAVNHHRANALKTFQAFVNAGSSEATRDAVLLETTRSIFAISPSGYLDGADSVGDPGSRLLEVIRPSGKT
ncbi:hypothetical protein FN976_07965 [Caenimonas sedimenti]|uniref:Uncharacterized protein n=1 Tax=Caenimonas sedimenti TaxID=2596921 RepID=A0A562ZU36_9BURK|nr:hypothetical protein [Caenimonas sedimenti]TWO71917.1 hypothetical protein FN976_07965 [Caenimonas sedimenti]